jgi:CCR4-NOT transcription complex subunit 6
MATSNVQGQRGMPFRIMSYNILSEIYATRQMYPHLDSWALAWPYRRMLLIKEIMEMHADVICLQEVQADHYERDLLPALQSMNYDGFYVQKSRESMGAYGKIDGCAIFWNCSKFMLVDSFQMDFNEIVRAEANRMHYNDAKTRKFINALCKDNIAQFVLLDFISSGPGVGPICIGNTHLYSNYMRPEVRLWQAYFFMNELSQIVSQRDSAVVLCGDFNSEPDSAVYEFLKRGRLLSTRPEIMNAEVNVLPKLDDIRHNFDLQSMMAQATGQEPLFTNYTANYKGVLDYIWFTQNNINVTHILVPPAEEDVMMRAGVGLPSTRDPSDHIALCGDLSVI